MNPAIDRAAGAGSAESSMMPTIGTVQTVNNVQYRTISYFGTCVIPTGMTLEATCAAGLKSGIQPAKSSIAGRTGTSYLRVVVAVSWAGARCPPPGCSYLTATLVSTTDDPLFNLGQSPPAAPVLTAPGEQTSAVGDTVSLPAIFTAVPSVRFAVTAGSLPAGLVLHSATGLITGTPSAVQPSTELSLTLTDGFGRATTASWRWTVLAALSATAPPAQASLIGTPLTLTLPSATGGSPGYAWSDPAATLPPGLLLSTVDNLAIITGTPTARGVFPVALTVTDSTSIRTSTVGFSWTTDYPPLVASNPGPQTSTVGAADSVTLSVTGGSGSFAWTGGETLPPGLTLAGDGIISGAATTAGITSVTLQLTDTITSVQQSVPLSWTVYPRPTVTSPGDQNLTIGLGVSLQLQTTCPNAPCGYLLTNGPTTLGISNTGLLTGMINGPARTYDGVTVSVTDNSGATVPSAAFAVRVNSALSIASPGDQIVAPLTAVSLQVAGLTAGGAAPLRYSAVNLPTWLALNPSTGVVSGSAPSTAGTSSGIILIATDATGVTAASPAFSWIVVGGGPPSTPGSVAVQSGDTIVTPSWTAPTGVVTMYTVTLSPGGASCSTVMLSCTIIGLTNGVAYSVSVTATNTSGTSPPTPAVIAIPHPQVMSAANGMTLWLDGADRSTMLGNTDCTAAPATAGIGCWQDKSGQSQPNNFAQATSANQPGVGTWNGLTAANFADTSDVLTSVRATANYLTVFMAANVTSSAVYIPMFGQVGVDYNVRIGTGTSRAAPNGNDWSFNPAGTLNWTNGAKLVNANGPMKVITTDQARSLKSFTASVSNPLYFRGLVGQVGDVITFDRALTTAERRSVEEYLARKWAVPITPQAPTSVTGVAVPTSATVSWTAPGFDGGAPINGYTVTATPGGKTCSAAVSLSCTVTGLTTRTSYTFSVTAANAAGVGPSSAPSSPVVTP
ncbi:MAG: putative Ig domain-containing protein [Nakamurella sp.]